MNFFLVKARAQRESDYLVGRFGRMREVAPA